LLTLLCDNTKIQNILSVQDGDETDQHDQNLRLAWKCI